MLHVLDDSFQGLVARAHHRWSKDDGQILGFHQIEMAVVTDATQVAHQMLERFVRMGGQAVEKRFQLKDSIEMRKISINLTTNTFFLCHLFTWPDHYPYRRR